MTAPTGVIAQIVFTNSGLPSLFHQVHFHFPSPPLLKTKLPLHRTSPVQGQIKQICGATLLAVLTIQSRPLCREPTFPCSITGAPGAGYWERGSFPHALREPLCCPALRPIPSNRGSLWLRCQLYLRFISLKHLYHTVPVLSTAFCKKLFKNWYLLLHSSLYRPLYRAGSAAWRPTPLPGCRCFP